MKKKGSVVNPAQPKDPGSRSGESEPTDRKVSKVDQMDPQVRSIIDPSIVGWSPSS